VPAISIGSAAYSSLAAALAAASPGATVNVDGTSMPSGGYVGGGTDSTALTINVGSGGVLSFGGSSATSLGNLIINGGTVTLNQNVTINGDFTLTAGTFDDGGQTVTFDGNFYNNAGTSAFTSSGTEIFAGSGSQTLGGSYSTTFDNLALVNPGGVNIATNFTASNVTTDIAPQITLNATVLSGREVLLTGVVSDNDPAGVTVYFSGAVSGQATTDLNGDFSYVTTTATLGTVSAYGIDQQAQDTNTALAVIATPAPTLSAAVSRTGTNTLTLTGQLADIDPAGETISISGEASGSAFTDANGNFTCTVGVSSSGTLVISGTDLWGQPSNDVLVYVTNTSSVVTASMSPNITLSAQVLPGQEVLLSGVLSDNTPSGAKVYFAGAVSGTTTTDSGGNFSFVTTAASLGTVTAYAIDQDGNSSNSASAKIAVAAPLLTMYVSNVSAGTVTVSGSLADIDQEHETVDYSGLASGSVTTDADGNFTFTVSTTAMGNLSAVATDEWGETSNLVTAAVPEQELAITEFSATHIAPGWSFDGRVVGADVLGAVKVTFGGLSAIAGTSVLAGADGTFCIIQTLAPTVVGNATAVAFDPYADVLSNVARTYVSNGAGASLTPNILNRGHLLDDAGDSVFVNFDGGESPDDPLTFSATNLPDGLTMNSETGIVSGTVAKDAISSTPDSVTIIAKDAYGNEATTSFLWTIAPAHKVTLTGFSFSVWLAPGDTVTSVDYEFSSSASGGTVYASGTGSVTLSGGTTNMYGYELYTATVTGLNVSVPVGTVFITLQNAVAPSGDPVYWGENDGASQAYENTLGAIGSESFLIAGQSGSLYNNGIDPGTINAWTINYGYAVTNSFIVSA
jgi:hypothetical protein